MIGGVVVGPAKFMNFIRRSGAAGQASACTELVKSSQESAAISVVAQPSRLEVGRLCVLADSAGLATTYASTRVR